jgi:hypothetical protein
MVKIQETCGVHPTTTYHSNSTISTISSLFNYITPLFFTLHHLEQNPPKEHHQMLSQKQTNHQEIERPFGHLVGSVGLLLASL